MDFLFKHIHRKHYKLKITKKNKQTNTFFHVIQNMHYFVFKKQILFEIYHYRVLYL